MNAKELEVPKYELSTKVFIAPNLLPEGTVILYNGVPGAAFIPRNAAAEAAVMARLKEKPDAFLNPIDQIPINGAPQAEVPEAEVVAFNHPSSQEVDLATLGQPGKARPGLTEGGTLPPSRVSE